MWQAPLSAACVRLIAAHSGAYAAPATADCCAAGACPEEMCACYMCWPAGGHKTNTACSTGAVPGAELDHMKMARRHRPTVRDAAAGSAPNRGWMHARGMAQNVRGRGGVRRSSSSNKGRGKRGARCLPHTQAATSTKKAGFQRRALPAAAGAAHMGGALADVPDMPAVAAPASSTYVTSTVMSSSLPPTYM